MKAIIALLFTFFLGACGGGTAEASPIVFVGDSITKGTDYGGVTREDTFAYKIGITNGYLPDEIFNEGVGSDTSMGVRSRLQSILNKRPRLVVLMIGINDWGRGVPVQSYSENLRFIFLELQRQGVSVVGITSNLNRGGAEVFSGFQPYLRAFEDEAKLAGIPVMDLYREVATSYLYLPYSQFQSLYVDSIHLTKIGHKFVTDLANRPKHRDLWKPQSSLP